MTAAKVIRIELTRGEVYQLREAVGARLGTVTRMIGRCEKERLSTASLERQADELEMLGGKLSVHLAGSQLPLVIGGVFDGDVDGDEGSSPGPA